MVLVCRSPILDEKRPKFKPDPEWTIKGIKAMMKLWWKRFTHTLPPLDPPRDDHYGVRWGVRFSTLTGALVVVMYMILSEIQIKRNTVLDGEDEIWTFSQVSVPSSLKALSSDHPHRFRLPLSSSL